MYLLTYSPSHERTVEVQSAFLCLNTSTKQDTKHYQMRLSLTLLYAAIGGQRYGHAFSSFRHRQIGHVAISEQPQNKNKLTNEEEAAVVHKNHKVVISRRQVMNSLMKSAIPLAFTMTSPRPSEAACLSGDVSPGCIGFYKLPLDDATAKYIDTPEHLAKYAPDLKWVPMTEYPKSYKAAKEELVELQAKLDTVAPMVLKGEFTEAGVLLLAITPRVTVAGRLIVRVLQKDTELSMRAMRTEDAHLELLGSLGSADIVIGQALGGRLGSTTMSQIQILDDLRNAEREFKELMKAIPEKP